jgi:hypothetical protein
MRRLRATAIVLATLAASAACSEPRSVPAPGQGKPTDAAPSSPPSDAVAKTETEAAPQPATTAGECQEDRMADDVLRLRQTTQTELSERRVGVANILERELPDANGVVAPRMSAMLNIHDPKTRTSVKEHVFEGSVVAIGADRYCVVSVEQGETAPGSISLRKLD